MRVAVFGAGYVGLVTGACFAELGHEVVVRDIVAAKIDALRGGRVPIHEPGLEELLVSNRERLSFTTDVGEAVANADVVYIAVGTPPRTRATPISRTSGRSWTSCLRSTAGSSSR